MQIFGVLLYYLPRGHIEMKYKSFLVKSTKNKVLKVLSGQYFNIFQILKPKRLLNFRFQCYIATQNLLRCLIYNLCTKIGMFAPFSSLDIKAIHVTKSHQTIKPSKVGFDKHLRMAFYDQRNERITCGNKVSVCQKV